MIAEELQEEIIELEDDTKAEPSLLARFLAFLQRKAVRRSLIASGVIIVLAGLAILFYVIFSGENNDPNGERSVYSLGRQLIQFDPSRYNERVVLQTNIDLEYVRGNWHAKDEFRTRQAQLIHVLHHTISRMNPKDFRNFTLISQKVQPFLKAVLQNQIEKEDRILNVYLREPVVNGPPPIDSRHLFYNVKIPFTSNILTVDIKYDFNNFKMHEELNITGDSVKEGLQKFVFEEETLNKIHLKVLSDTITNSYYGPEKSSGKGFSLLYYYTITMMSYKESTNPTLRTFYKNLAKWVQELQDNVLVLNEPQLFPMGVNSNQYQYAAFIKLAETVNNHFLRNDQINRLFKQYNIKELFKKFDQERKNNDSKRREKADSVFPRQLVSQSMNILIQELQSSSDYSRIRLSEDMTSYINNKIYSGDVLSVELTFNTES